MWLQRVPERDHNGTRARLPQITPAHRAGPAPCSRSLREGSMFRLPSRVAAAAAAAIACIASSGWATPVTFDLADFSVDATNAKLGPNGTAIVSRGVSWNIEENVG